MKFNVDINKKVSKSPISENLMKNTGTVINQDIYAYQQRINFINYAVVIIRLDVTYAVFKLSEFLINSFRTHLNAIDRVFFYLAHIKRFAIKFKTQTIDSQFIFLASSDASYADDSNTKYSSQGYGFMLFNDLID